MATVDENQAPAKKSRLFVFLLMAVAILVIVGAVTLLQRRSQYEALAKNTEETAIPTVAVIHPTVESSSEDLVLPGNLQAYVESPIYARTNGYLKQWYHDIGARVHKGELLDDIETPEIDQQLAQAKADLGTAQANANLSGITAARFEELLKTDGVSKQEVDNAAGDLAAKQAIVASAQANVRRLEELESFKHIYAPFGGVITKRNVDIGTLVNAGNNGSQLLFTLAQTDPIRVYVSVPEQNAASMRAGLAAFLELSQYPGKKFEGSVVRTSEAIDPATRTLLTEVDVPNRAGELLPGGYAQVHLRVAAIGDHLQVPVNALLFRSEGLRAVVVDANHKTRLQPLVIGRDYGTSLEVLQGLNASDWIVVNPPDSLDDGQTVKAKEMAQKPPALQNAPPATQQGGPGAPKPQGEKK